MKRSINNTNRKKITQEQFSVSTVSDVDFKKLKLQWDLSSLGLDPTNLIHVEFSTLSAMKRVELGTVNSGIGELELDNPLSNSLAMSAVIRASVNVIDGPRLWTAVSVAKSVLNSNQDVEQNSILPIVPVADLKVVWKLDFEGKLPVLQISNSEEIFGLLKNIPTFFASIVPAVFQQIAIRFMLGIEDSREWEHWPSFFEQFGISSEDLDEWDLLEADARISQIMQKADSISEEFSTQLDIVKKVTTRLKEQIDA